MNWMLMLLKSNADALSMVDGDGHTLYNPEYLIKKGYPVEFVKRITDRHESDYSNGKSTIFGLRRVQWTGVPSTCYR